MSGHHLRVRGLRVGGDDTSPGIDLDLDGGATLAVTGPATARQSALLLCLVGRREPVAGEVERDVDGRVAYVPADHELAVSLTVRENVLAPLLDRRGSDPAASLAAVDAVLDRLGISGTADRLVETASGGQRQRAAVARALVTDPVLLVADEPTSELDTVARDLVVDRLLEHAALGNIVVVKTDDPDVARRCSHQLRITG